VVASFGHSYNCMDPFALFFNVFVCVCVCLMVVGGKMNVNCCLIE